jgi:hypothetical protein
LAIKLTMIYYHRHYDESFFLKILFISMFMVDLSFFMYLKTK